MIFNVCIEMFFFMTTSIVDQCFQCLLNWGILSILILLIKLPFEIVWEEAALTYVKDNKGVLVCSGWLVKASLPCTWTEQVVFFRCTSVSCDWSHLKRSIFNMGFSGSAKPFFESIKNRPAFYRICSLSNNRTWSCCFGLFWKWFESFI